MARRGVVPGFRFDGKAKRAAFEVILPGTCGRLRRRKVLAVETRDQALALFRKFRTAALASRKAEPEFFSEYVRRFWPLMKLRLKKRTAVEESSVVEKILVPFFGAHRLKNINAALVRDFAALLRAHPYAPSRINRIVAILKKILNDAVSREVLAEFPAKGRLPREKESLLRLELSPEEKARFLYSFENEAGFRKYFAEHRSAGKVVSSPHFGGAARVFGGGLRPDGEAAAYYFKRFAKSKPFFVVALETGLRRGDLLALRWSSVDFAAGWVRVAAEKTKREAVIPMSQSCREALLICRRGRGLSDFVFVSEGGTPLSWSTLKRHFQLAKKIAGITRRFRFHDLRHTFGSTLASRGVSLQVIAKALGHASVRMSERYARPSEEALQEIKKALDDKGSAG